jgi:hypothetical protein
VNKRQGERRHAKKRLRQRYGINAGSKFLSQMISMIRSQKAVLIRRQSLRVSLYWVTINDVRYKVVYDRKRKMIVTALPPKSLLVNNNPY